MFSKGCRFLTQYELVGKGIVIVEQTVCNFKNYHYSAFGLRIDSQIRLPELYTGQGKKADVRLVYGVVPEQIDAPIIEEKFFQASEDKFLFRVLGVASFYVCNGDLIIVQPEHANDLRETHLYLLGTVMGLLLLQRGMVPIHGSSVVFGGQGIVFAGTSGAGKSTLAAALRQNGYSFLADDISAVVLDDTGFPQVQPGYPQQKLHQTSADMNRIDTANLKKILEGEDKYAVPVAAGYRRPVPLAAVYEIDVKPGAEVAIVPVQGIDKLTILINHTFRGWLMDGLKLKKDHFQKCAILARHIQVFRITRPENLVSLERQVDVLKQHFTTFAATGKTHGVS